MNALSDFNFRVWAYLITYVDDYGRGSADPELLKGLVFPRRKGITEQQISGALETLASSGMITLYEKDGELYFCFPRWEIHQQIRAKKSRFPAPDSTCKQMISFDSKCPRNPIQSESNPNPNPNPGEQRAREAQKPVRAQRAEPEDEDGFEAFWNAYPRKSGDIREAYFAYRGAIEAGATLQEMLEAIRWQAEIWRQDDPTGRYIPSPQRWLENRKWTEKKPDAQGAVKDSTAEAAADLDRLKRILEGL